MEKNDGMKKKVIMGVFLCIGQHHHGLTYNDAMQIKDLTIINKKVTENIEHYLNNVEDKIALFLGDSKRKIKKKAEQAACKNGLDIIEEII